MQPATRPADFPITSPSTPAGKGAAKAHKAWVDQYDRAHQVETDYGAAQRKLEEATATMRDVLAKRELGEATAADAKAAEDAHAAAKAEAEAPWHERARAAVGAAETKRHEYEAFIDDNLDDLVAELAVDAQAAVDTMRAAAQTLMDGAAAWRDCQHRATNLIKPAQAITGQAVPVLESSADEAVAAASRLLENGKGLSLPLPGRRHLDQRRMDLGLPVKRQYIWKGQDGAPV